MIRIARSLLAAVALTATRPAVSISYVAPLRVARFSPPEWSRSSSIYEVNVRQYTPEGTFNAFRQHLPRLHALGVDILWIMPVQPIGKLNRKGGLGSPYSISDYVAINPEYGTAADFKAIVDDAHHLGMHVILDWVANHTSFDNVWVAQHRDWYLLKPDGSISNAVDGEGHETDWTDVAQLNYRSAAMRHAMIEDMRWWVRTMGIDGFRCDVAGNPPIDFWIEARRELQQTRPDLFMLAEAESPKMYAAFDMTYGWEFHHLLNEIAQHKRSTAELDDYFVKQAREFPPTAYRMYFTSNHDENSWSGSEFERMGENHAPAFVLAATTSLSMPLIYTGQEVSNRKRLRFFDKDTVDWTGGPSLSDFYSSMIELKTREPALWNGAWGGTQAKLETTGGGDVYAFTRSRGTNDVLVAVNFADTAARVGYTGLTHPGSYTDWFTKTVSRQDTSGVLTIPAHGYRILVRPSRAGTSSSR